jgi:sialate O-acetylesterase
VIEGNEVVVSADGVSEITAVRFGWHELAEPNLANKEGLPAYPFRTDSWK